MERTTGTTTWVDLGTLDFAAAQRFYTELFGWSFEDMGEDFGHYHLIRNQGGLVGGIMDISGMTCPDGEPLASEWGVFLAVDDAEARAATAEAHGAQLVMPIQDIGASGRTATLLDPTGALISIWQPGELQGYDFTMATGSPVWFELMTHHFDQASNFYTQVFDANLVSMSESMDDNDFRYVTNGPENEASWGLGDATGVMPEEAAGWRIYLAVDSCDAAAQQVQELGGRLLDGPVDSPFGRIATVSDPTGATFQICAMSEAVPEG
ncbi:VOC family protein [Citricoccus muralis]|uniref:VOC family protein n=1 Tax=Citricoccus muralis TaxID=169134 RepID=A0ABY8H503_9MICC|nr:VOC family protein [Citricoccus muralis]WFP15733.1 VOC family protein [Citricoccus muralis]